MFVENRGARFNLRNSLLCGFLQCESGVNNACYLHTNLLDPTIHVLFTEFNDRLGAFY